MTPTWLLAAVQSKRVLLIAAVSVAALVTLAPIQTTYDYVCRTEVVVVDLSEAAAPDIQPWYFEKVRIFEGFETSARDFTGSIRPATDTSIEMERVLEGPFRIRLRSRRASAPVATLTNSETEETSSIQNRLVIVVEGIRERSMRGASIVLPIDGAVVVGRRLGNEVSDRTPILREGTVTLLGRSILSGTLFRTGLFQLSPGDELTVRGAGLFSKAFVALDDRLGFQVIGRAQTSQANVDRFGSQGYAIRASWWARLTSDLTVQGLWAVLAASIAGSKLWASWRQS